MNNGKLLLGAHISTSGGFYKAIERGESIGCTAIQIFTKSNRQWHSNKITLEEAGLFKQRLKESSVKEIVAHASYLINIASEKEDVVQKSKIGLVDELSRCDELGIPYLVIHPGSSSKSSDEIIDQFSSIINDIYSTYSFTTILLLETMAGQGNSIAYTFEQIAEIIKKIKHKNKIGVCIDTCHIFAAGYDISNKDSYEKTISEFDKIIGLSYLKVIHLNDSKKELGCKVDRHEFISKGKIGLKAFELIMNDHRLLNTVKILETPADTLEDYAIDLQLLISLLDLPI